MPWKLRDQMNADEEQWLKYRRECGRDADCVSRAYDSRMRELSNRYCASFDNEGQPIIKGSNRYDCTM
jgi:uncharacterized protein